MLRKVTIRYQTVTKTKTGAACMKKVHHVKMLLFLGCLFAAGCYYHIEEELYPNNTGTCDLIQITFSSTVNSILINNGCIGCHGGTFPSGNISLQGYTQVKRKVDDGTLWGAINHLPGFSPMPQGGNKMNSCDISRIKAWIDAGSPNN
jgi:hypothetical protein